jgi:hypothetical protein
MADLSDVRDALYAVSEHLLRRPPSPEERSALVAAFNAQPKSRPIFERCIQAIADALGIDLRSKILQEKTASVDRVRQALANLKAVAAQAAASK